MYSLADFKPVHHWEILHNNQRYLIRSSPEGWSTIAHGQITWVDRPEITGFKNAKLFMALNHGTPLLGWKHFTSMWMSGDDLWHLYREAKGAWTISGVGQNFAGHKFKTRVDAVEYINSNLRF